MASGVNSLSEQRALRQLIDIPRLICYFHFMHMCVLLAYMYTHSVCELHVDVRKWLWLPWNQVSR